MTAALLQLPVKRCYSCNEIKNISEFHAGKHNSDGKASQCKVCMRTKGKAWRKKSREDAYISTKAYSYQLFLNVRSRAKRLSIPFNLERGDVNIPPCCPILGIPLIRTKEPTPGQATIDKIKPELGYVKGNVQIISRLANQIKAYASADQILAVGHYMKEIEDG